MSVERQENEASKGTDLAAEKQDCARNDERQRKTVTPIELLALKLLDIRVDGVPSAPLDLGLDVRLRQYQSSYPPELSLHLSSFRNLRSEGRP